MPKNIYRNKAGEILPGTTTICNQLGKGEGLMNWSHKIAYESTVELTKRLSRANSRQTFPKYEDIQKWQSKRDSAGDIGTLVHEAVLYELKNPSWVASFQDEVVLKCYNKFLDWWLDELWTPSVRLVEIPLVSEKLQFGGQPDLLYTCEGKNILCDIKTGGKWVYDDWWLQLAGYDILLRENGYKVDEYQILWLPKDGRFGCPIRKNLTKEKKIFKALLEIYKLRKDCSKY